jgi:CHASE2 domain-containing sensor protein
MATRERTRPGARHFASFAAVVRSPRFYINFAFLGAFAFFWVVLNPFRVLDLEIPPFNRLMAVAGAYYDYPDTARDSITVVTMDDGDPFIAKRSWPLSVDQWRQVIGRVACLAPKAIMVDVLLYRKDSDSDWNQFLATLDKVEAGTLDCPDRVAPAKPIPVILARGTLTEKLGSDRLEEKNLAVTEWPAQAGYPLTVSDAENHAGSTPAFALLSRLCPTSENWALCPKNPPAAGNENIEVAWGLKFPADREHLVVAMQCPASGDLILSVAGDLFRSLFERSDGHFQPCSYHRRVTIEQMDAIHENCMAIKGTCPAEHDLFEGKVIFIGARLKNISDEIYSPIHDRLDGVFYHAMAFDNLISLGDRYYRNGLVTRIWCWIYALLGLFVACYLGAIPVSSKNSFRRGALITTTCAVLLVVLVVALIRLRLLLPADSQVVFGLGFTFFTAAGIELEFREWIIQKLEATANKKPGRQE